MQHTLTINSGKTFHILVNDTSGSKTIKIGTASASGTVVNNGTVNIAFNGAGVYYAKLVNGTFQTSIVDGDQYSQVDTDRAIAVDNNGGLHIGYRNVNRSKTPHSNSIHYASLDNGSWNLSTITNYGGGLRYA